MRERFKHISVKDKGRVYNSNLMHTIETGNLLELAEVLLTAALVREESRGGHARRDFTTRDDEKFLKHTLVTKKDGKPVLSYKPVTITTGSPWRESTNEAGSSQLSATAVVAPLFFSLAESMAAKTHGGIHG